MKRIEVLHSQQVQLGHPRPASRPAIGLFALLLELGLLNRVLGAAAGIAISVRKYHHGGSRGWQMR